MKAIGQYVLIEQTAIKRKSQIITEGKMDIKDTHIITNKVLQLGKKIEDPEIEIGDNPIFGEHTNFGNVKIVSSTEQKTEALILVHYSDIIGIDNIEEEEK